MGSVEWISGGVTLPAKVEEAFWSDQLVFFCGAGVSSAKPSELPGFRGLAEDVANTLGHPELVPSDKSIPVQFDVVMGKLDEISGDVHGRVSTRLQVAVTPNAYHLDIWRIAGAQGKTPRIVTTNFDLLFEAAANRIGVEQSVHVAPTLPLGDDFSGLVHLHGIQHPPASSRMVLTDRDFGRAYITEGWATEFLTRLFAKYTVLLVGYSAEDTIIQYLNRALPNNGERFAFTRSADEYGLWRRLGVTPVPFPSTPDDQYGALETFVKSWSARLSAEPSERFDEMVDFVTLGPEAAERSPNETAWKMGDPELARHFRLHARASDWLRTLDRMGVVDALFDPVADTLANPYEWAQWVRASIDDDDGESLLGVLARHEGRLQQELWFHIWHKMYGDFNGSIHHRRLVFVLAVSQQPRESDRLSMLLARTAESDPETAESLLLQMLTPQLSLKVRNSWGFRDDALETRLRLHWRSTSIRDAWPKLMPQLSDRAHLLSVVLNLIRTVEKTDAYFTAVDREDAISSRRDQVEHAERYSRDDPYILVVDIARDLLREQVRDHGTRDAIRHVDDRSEMIRRLAIDALSEARSSEADALVRILMQQALPFAFRSRPEVFRLMAATYKNATEPMRLLFLDYIQSTTQGPRDAEVTDYARYNVFVWLSSTADADDPVQTFRSALESEHGFKPEELPNLTSVRRFTPVPDDPQHAEGRFRSMDVGDVVDELRDDRTLRDEYSDGPILREIHDYLAHAVDAHLPLLDEMIVQGVWSSSAWRVILQSMVRGTTWVANDLLHRLEVNVENSADIASRLDFAVAYPENELNRPLNNVHERSRLLLGLWRMATREVGDQGPTDPSDARSTPRGSLAHYYTEALLRAAQQEGEEARIAAEGRDGLQELLDAQGETQADPSPMMLAEYASNLQFRAPEWFGEQLLPRLRALDNGPHARALWAGLLTRKFPGPRLREALQNEIRTGWSQIESGLPGSIEPFIQLHSICFAFDFGHANHEWADAFLTHAPESARERWIRSVAHYLDQEGEPSEYEELLFAHWSHRLDGQPPISQSEQRALLRWLTLPGIDVSRAAELFVRGPAVAVRDEDLHDYYDLDGFPNEEHPVQYVRVANHLMQMNVTPPPFVEQLLAAVSQIASTHEILARQTLNKLLSLGYSPARTVLESMG